jgi:acetylglutamate kinase
MKAVYILKIGGEVLQDPASLNEVLVAFVAISGPKILVHGGGREVTDLSRKLGVEPQIVEGRRITDAFQLDLALMLYSGKINTQLVASLQSLGLNCAGFNGSDLNLIQCKKREISSLDYGYVGDITQINAEAFTLLLNQGVCPVLCSITHDGNGQLLNTNADTIATEVAKALSAQYAVSLDLLMGPSGIMIDLSDEHSLIERLSLERYNQLFAEGALSDGILPKLHNAFSALEKGVKRVRVGNKALIQYQKGTEICL